jgi:hypothetical protein
MVAGTTRYAVLKGAMQTSSSGNTYLGVRQTLATIIDKNGTIYTGIALIF